MLELVSITRTTTAACSSPRKTEPVGEKLWPSERETHERDEEHPQGKQDDVAESKFALIGLLTKPQKPECRKDQMLRLLAHDQVQYDWDADECQAAEE